MRSASTPTQRIRSYVIGPVNNDVLEKLVVNSDDLCDNKVITIKEEDGKLQVYKESRVSEPMVSSTSTSTATLCNDRGEPAGSNK